MDEQHISYALAKQVPDMARGFTVGTAYGDIVIPPGKLARHLQANMERALVRELGLVVAQRTKHFAVKPMTFAQCSSMVNELFGGTKTSKKKATNGGAA